MTLKSYTRFGTQVRKLHSSLKRIQPVVADCTFYHPHRALPRAFVFMHVSRPLPEPRISLSHPYGQATYRRCAQRCAPVRAKLSEGP